MAWWWLSFVDNEKNPGSQFLGVAIVEGEDLSAALTRANALGINPGGEVAAWPIPPEFAPQLRLYTERLLSRAELKSADLAGEPLGNNAEARAAATGVCACCNGALHKRSVN